MVAQLGLWPLLACFFVLVTCVGFVLPNAAALTLDGHGANAGAASAVLGSTQFLIGGLAAPLVGTGSTASALPTAAVLGGAGLVTLLLLAWLATDARAARRADDRGVPPGHPAVDDLRRRDDLGLDEPGHVRGGGA